MMWVPLIMLCTSLGKPHHCLKFFITLLILALVGHAITFLKRPFIIAMNSYNNFEIVDLLIAKSSLHIKRSVPWASLYIAHYTHISIGITFRYWVSCFISTCHNWLTMWKRQAFVILKFQPIYHPRTQWEETGKN